MARTRYTNSEAEIPLDQLPAAALRAVLAEGYSLADLRADVLAGAVVGMVALPLAMALAVAVGVPPQHGLDTAIVAGFLVAALGGSRTQVTGPTAAFVVVLAPIYAKFGLAGLLVSGLLGGVILIVMALLRFGKFIQFVPYPVTTGFTAGIATVIATLQLKDLLGLKMSGPASHFLEHVGAMWRARGTVTWAEPAIGLLTLAVLLLFPRVSRRLPAPLVALPVGALAALALSTLVPEVHVATIASRFQSDVGGQIVHGIPRLPPLPLLPWNAPGRNGAPFSLDFETLRDLLSGAFAVAMLGAIESLLSAVVADGMARTRHDPDAELLSLGVGNIVAPFFGGIPATGAIARTATNIRYGARSPIAAMVHALTVLAAVLLLAPLLGYLPMASLAALLLLVAWNMSEAKHFAHMLAVAPRSDVAVLVSCYVLTVVFDMTVGVAVGMVLASLLFMQGMAEVTESHLVEGLHPDLPGPIPPGVVVYDISGPLFFGAAQKAMSALGAIADRVNAVILRMDGVPTMDATGIVALESALDQLARYGCLTVITGVQPQPRQVLARAGIEERENVLICEDAAEAHFIAAGWKVDIQPGAAGKDQHAA